MTEDFLIGQKFGRRRPFKVPEGYFEQLEKSVMQNLPEQPVTNKPATKRSLRILRWAACATAVIAVAAVCYNKVDDKALRSQSQAVTAAASSVTSGDYTLDEVSDFAMLDKEDIYAYLSEE